MFAKFDLEVLDEVFEESELMASMISKPAETKLLPSV